MQSLICFSNLLQSIQDVINKKCLISYVSSGSSNGSDDSEIKSTPIINNSSNKKVEQELDILESYKCKKYWPTLDRSKSRVLSGVDHEGKLHEILVDPVLEQGKNLCSGKNLVEYTCEKAYYSMIRFFMDHEKIFPSLSVIIQCESACSPIEVGCKRYFSVLGYVSAPCQTRLVACTYERLVLMSMILNKVYIDKNGWWRNTYGGVRWVPGIKRRGRRLSNVGTWGVSSMQK